MSADDLIKRGDALAECNAVIFAAEAAEAIAAMPAVTPKVRPLVWAERNGVWCAETIIGEYSVGFDDGWWCELIGPAYWDWEPSEDRRSYCGPSAAMAAAQAHFDAAIRGEVILTPAPDAAAIREATARLHKLAYWLDTDAEVLADMDQRDLSDHQHIQAEVNAILALIQKGGA